MGCLARALPWRGEGLGALPIGPAVERCLQARQSVGGYDALSVDANGEEAKFFCCGAFALAIVPRLWLARRQRCVSSSESGSRAAAEAQLIPSQRDSCETMANEQGDRVAGEQFGFTLAQGQPIHGECG